MMPDISLNATKSAALTHHLVLQTPVVLIQKDATSKAQNRKQRKGIWGGKRSQAANQQETSTFSNHHLFMGSFSY